MSDKHIKNIETKLLSDNYYILNRVTFDYLMSNGEWVNQMREVYDRGDGAGILLYNKAKQTVILTKQFRMPTYLNDNKDGFLVEVAAGMLDKDNPEACIIRETEEEVGYRLKSVKKIYEAYSSPGVMTEKMHFFIGEYTDDMKVNEGGGVDTEHEDIEVLEMPFKNAVKMLNNGEIVDTRTIVLLQYAIIHKLLE
ncbi:NUDIX domain-containing protein [Algibacter amylolyticus]|uniref:GDP-mannose pyrophosphatase n=2 Tax=Algibacter TaxID=261827 RepID=A0A1I1PA68_9FLAO|nr:MULTISPECIES: NUDIX domain-containing protein [Algibacter]KAA5825654.1 NUDIX domain-containing protein [Algibacter amylolyticus]MBB5268116.1 nudix-type nucleoside diphosphatase (YffH/AdpP family) [Algibacter amylolyticus]TSJ79952.1 NUDIX domain-containing protein [Algibacter amylolyticus]SFD06727.1 nudix-type nucleoside diphosphatase, YffH/AdpP family [Algibacter pectinivorans]